MATSVVSSNSSYNDDDGPEFMVSVPTPTQKKPLSFWLIFISLCLSLFLSALELTGVSTALPVIVKDLNGAQFAWVGSAYSLASTAFLPMSGGVAEIFGRRLSMVGAILLFALGGGLCGGAKTMHWLIASRAIQGLGGGAIISLSSIIVSDLVSLRERGAYNGLLALTWAIAAGIGPVVGGALASKDNWRWLFYLNLPICGISLAMVLLFLKLPTPPGTIRDKLARMDWIGNLIVMTSTAGVVLGLTWGGSTYPWASTAVLVPLIIGVVGYVLFFVYEFYFAKNPIIPFEIMSNRTSVSGYIQNFLNSLVVLSIAYYLPVYFQACKGASPVHSGVLVLGMTLALGPSAVVSGISVRLIQRYRPQLWIGWLLFIPGMAGFTTFSAMTSVSVSVGVPIIVGAGCGILYSVTYFPVLAPLPVELNAHALAFFAFCRSFAAVWGITIGSTILQNQLPKHLAPSTISSLPILSNGRLDLDLAFTLIPSIKDLPEPVKHEVQVAFAAAVAVIWKAMCGLLAVGFLSSLCMKSLPLQGVVDDKWSSPGKPSALGQAKLASSSRTLAEAVVYEVKLKMEL